MLGSELTSNSEPKLLPGYFYCSWTMRDGPMFLMFLRANVSKDRSFHKRTDVSTKGPMFPNTDVSKD